MKRNRSFARGKFVSKTEQDAENSPSNANNTDNGSHNSFGSMPRQVSHRPDTQEVVILEDLLLDKEFSVTVPNQRNHSFSNALLISNEEINERYRFSVLFAVLLVIVAGSTQGLHSVFGTLLMQSVYRYSVKEMMTVYLTGQTFGMFVFPFGILYDWFGPRIPILLCTILMAAGNMLFALMFSGHISHTVTKSAIIYAVMCWGCYGTQVCAIPCAVNYMPRNRGQPLGFLVTFSNLGASLFACFFRGFFPDRYDHLMWFMFAFCVISGLFAVWYVGDAPYITTRWERGRLTLKKKVDRYLIRNRYMSQLIPKRRFYLFMLCLTALNFYLTIQAIIAGYRQQEMTKGEYRGISIGAVFVVMLTTVLIWPFRFMDGEPEPDTEFIHIAKEKEREINQHSGRLDLEERDAAAEEQQSQDNTSVFELIEVDLTASAHETKDTIRNPLDEGVGNALPSTDAQIHPFDVRSDVSRPFETVSIEGGRQNSTAGDLVQDNRQEHAEHVPKPLVLASRRPSTYAAPYFEMINIGHEGFLTPVYEISFWKSLFHLDVWIIFYTTFVIWGIGMTMTGNWNIYVMLGARDPDMKYEKYILFAAMSGINMAGGRSFIGIYEQILNQIYLRYGTPMLPTWAYPVASIGFFISMILWIALPGNYSLIVSYVFGPAMYGMNNSMTFYILSSMFDRDIGMHYSFSFLASAIGMVVFYYLAWYLPYNHNSTDFPLVGRMCRGKRKCMNTTVAIYIAFSFSSVVTSYWLHLRYKRLLEGKGSKEKRTS